MKKLLLFLLCLPIFTFVKPILAISAESYIVMDADSKRVITGKNITKEKLIASTTKIMTSIIAIETTDLNKVIKVGDEVLKAYGSAIYINMGEEITLNDLLYGLMLRSGNDAAIEIAYACSGSMAKFVEKMNAKAYELGMSNTSFVNNHGLEENDGTANTSTAYDMALLMQYALKNEKFKEIISTKNYTAKTSGKTYSWKNKNKLLFTYDNLIGGKTGYTKKALRTLVTAAQKDNKTTIVVTLNDGNDFKDHYTLHEETFKNYERVELLNNEIIKEKTNNPNFYIEENFYALLKKDEQKNIRIEININNNNIDSKEALVYLKDELLGSLKILEKKEEEKKEEKSNIFIKFFRWLTKW